ncbi:hypothetical protein GTP23_13545 [Pseudoduganella sp. FT93W]|uniref:Gluconate 2-dehydrogenase subunit 3 family protein n=1 Tax=Duganella fentianensis TaxID=2692177 RepID=A0A845HXF6_9BURK|nr:gluconate 2-dehydrogenase subunit 3 family protein [Duganella fentianensis]MYN46074.1 hypothetical protein [Duganella fentianensis]
MIARDNSDADSAANAAYSTAQLAVLDLLLASAIPASGRKPAGNAVGFAAFAVQAGMQTWLAEGLDSVDALAVQQHGMALAALAPAPQQELITAARRKQFRFFGELSGLLMQCYYQHDAVLEAIGQEARPPFPQGYVVHDGDLSLLEAVYERGPIYRSTD